MGHLRDKPADGALLKERGTSTVYRYEGGTRRPIISEDVFKRSGYKWKRREDCPDGQPRPACRSASRSSDAAPAD